jgi:hypothetical protein
MGLIFNVEQKSAVNKISSSQPLVALSSENIAFLKSIGLKVKNGGIAKHISKAKFR